MELFQLDQFVATHRRSYGREEDHLELDHYLEVLARKPGALRDAKPWRRADVPATYRHLFEELKGSSKGTREFASILMMRRDGDRKTIDDAVELAVSKGMYRLDVIEQLIARAVEDRPPIERIDVSDGLQSIAVPAVDLSRYDGLVIGSREVSA